MPDQIYKERKNLAYTLQDARGVVSKLELIMGVMMHVLFVFFYLIIFDVSCTLSWKLLRSQVNPYIPHALASLSCCEATCSRIGICKGPCVTPACISAFRR